MTQEVIYLCSSKKELSNYFAATFSLSKFEHFIIRVLILGLASSSRWVQILDFGIGA